MRKLAIVNEPNDNFYGIRNRRQYRNQLYADLVEELEEYSASIGLEVKAFQSNGEGTLINYFQSLYFEAKRDGCKIPLILNPGTFTHYSYAIKDTLESVHTLISAIEVRMSNIHGRDDLHHIFMTASECLDQIAGVSKRSYKIAIETFKRTVEEGQP